MKHLVIGDKGQVGSAVYKVLKEKHDVEGIDKDESVDGKFDHVHICIPYTEEFTNAVKTYKNLYLKEGGITIIHSTVPLGTSEELEAQHSPIRGVHPNLYDGVKTFIKYFGGPRAIEAAAPFKLCGVEVACTHSSKETEALKLWDTTYYGWNIMFNKMVKDYCDEHDLNFNLVYTHANASYNKGYHELGVSYVIRPVLKYMQGVIGGHCVIPNCELLGGDIAEFILEHNKKYEV